MYFIKQLVCDIFPSSAFQIQTQITDRPFATMNVVVIILQRYIKLSFLLSKDFSEPDVFFKSDNLDYPHNQQKKYRL